MGVIRLIAALAVVLGLTVIGVIWQSSRMWTEHGLGRSIARPVDAAIVLASGVDPDLVAGYSTRRRVSAGIALWRAGRTKALIMSGGPAGGDVTAAALMRDLAIDAGVPEDAVLIEDRSRTTFENLRFSVEIARSAGHIRLAVVTDRHHLRRAGLLAAWFGHEVELVAARGLEHQSRYVRTVATVREALAWWYNLYKVAAWSVLSSIGFDPGGRDLVY